MKILFKVIALSATLSVAFSVTHAARYTASVSGNYASNSTWQGGIAPPFTFADTVDIPQGITITCNNDIKLLKNASFTINGILNAANHYLNGLTSQIYGNGTIHLDSTGIAGNASGNGTFRGAVFTNVFNFSAGGYIERVTMLHVFKKLYVPGTISIDDLGHLYVYNDAEIIMVGNNLQTHKGNIYVGSGKLHLPQRYNLKYTGGNIITGIELYGSGLNNIEIDPGNNFTVTLSTDLVNFRKLILTSGKLLVNQHMVMFTPHADIALSGTGELDYTKEGSMAIYAKNGLSGNIRFTRGENWINDFTIDAPMIFELPKDCRIIGTLTLRNGKINIRKETLILGSGYELQGGNKNSYIIVEEGGIVVSSMRQTTRWFPIGTYKHYAPCHVYMDYPTQKSFLTVVGLASGVSQYANSGYNMAWHQPVVDATWYVQMHPDAKLTVQWDSTMEVNAFDRSTAYIAEFEDGTGWIKTSNNSHVNYAGYDYYTCAKTLGTINKWFAVFSGNTAVDVSNTETANVVQIYPNPASDVIHIPVTHPVKAIICNSIGTVVFSGRIDRMNNAINITALPQGCYSIQLCSAAGNNNTKFVKL